MPYKIIFAGTPEFAARTLEALLRTTHTVCAVYTQPDRPAGRGQKLTPSPVKQLALTHDIPVYQPRTLRSPEVQEELRDLQADIMIVVAYGLILPPAVLSAPRLGCLNIHASLLPRWRGAAPIQRALLAGDTETGITVMQMNEGLDTGDMLVKLSCPILANDTAETLHDRLAGLGPRALMLALAQLENGSAKPERQDEGLACYAPKIDKSEAEIDWSQAAAFIERQIRAFNPWPVTHTQWGDKTLRVWRAQLINTSSSGVPGTVVDTNRVGIDVATGQGILRLLQIQLPGKRPLAAAEFLNAHHLERGIILGSPSQQSICK